MDQLIEFLLWLELSKWKYFLIAVGAGFIASWVFSTRAAKNVQRTVQLTILVSLFAIIAVAIGFAVIFGFTGDLTGDLSVAMVVATGFVLLAIFLWSRLTRKQRKPEMEEGWACVYTTNNEHEAQLVRIGLEGGH